MKVVQYRIVFYIISAVLMASSIAAISIWGLNFGIDFKGGSIIEVEYSSPRPSQESVRAALAPLALKESVRATGDTGYIIRTRDISHEEKIKVDSLLAVNGAKFTEKRFDSIGPLLGKEAARKSIISIVLVILAIVLFIAFAFRKVSKPVASWKYGIAAIIALLHDVVIPTGVFAVLGHYLGYEIDTLFVTALLVILGFSIHDTIVVFDRVRENLNHNMGKDNFEVTVGKSVSQTFARSVNTSLTTLIALIVLYFVGGEATHHFSLALIIGIIAGTYSSIFIGSTLLVTFEKWSAKAAASKKLANK
mgnify:CR=1 FL=1